MKESIESQIIKETESMNAKGAMDAVGIDPGNPLILGRLAEVVEEHELGATPRAVLVFIRGWLQRNGQVLRNVIGLPDKRQEFKEGLPASSSISRIIPLALAMNNHLRSAWEHPETTIIDLGAGRAHAAQVALHPELLQHEFFQRFRVSMDPSYMPPVDRVIAVDSRDASYEDATQVYWRPDGTKSEKVHAIDELEALGDHGGRLVKVFKDIRELTPEELLAATGEEETNRLFFLNNVLYAIQENQRKEIQEAVNSLAEGLNADILQMEGWNVFHDQKPEIYLPGRDKPLNMPAFVRLGRNLDDMKVVAELDGNTGKPHIQIMKDGSRVFIDENCAPHQID